MMNKSSKSQFISVVDDELDLVYLFKDALSQIEGVQVFAFTDPNMALEHFQLNHQNYRVVITDYRMPGMNGMQLLDKIKEINPTVKRMLISAFEINDNVFQEHKCVDKYLQKPISMVTLIDEVEICLKPIEAQKIDKV
jgi:DNA-binding NtrC family response regulator